MATVRLRNMSRRDLDVPLPWGGTRVVRAGEQIETTADHADRLAEQEDVWRRVDGKQPTKKGGEDA